ncbi:hypothetical protein [Paracoccus sp. (in: a-proteobacteria)]|uniref:hypothetical protein n=1 Tax=Paracoccus sp. TaxID=267 RepID=UPI0028ABB697|nr:hypothetical protein [Paracoccus sp. (in: a-proteobacteria)]
MTNKDETSYRRVVARQPDEIIEALATLPHETVASSQIAILAGSQRKHQFFNTLGMMIVER